MCLCVLSVGSLIQRSDECESIQTFNALGAAHQSSGESVFVTHEHTKTHTQFSNQSLIWNPSSRDTGHVSVGF